MAAAHHIHTIAIWQKRCKRRAKRKIQLGFEYKTPTKEMNICK